MMTGNKLLTWSLIVVALYWIVGLTTPLHDYTSSAMSFFLLLVTGGVTFLRYGPEAWRIVVNGKRDAQPGSHLAAYGVALVALGSIYTGAFGLSWVAAGQPSEWLATPMSGFARGITGAGFAMLFLSPDMTRQGLELPRTIWIILIAVVFLLIAFVLGVQIGLGDAMNFLNRSHATVMTECPGHLPVKGSRAFVGHRPDDAPYMRTVPIACFKNQRIATVSGFRTVGTGQRKEVSRVVASADRYPND